MALCLKVATTHSLDSRNSGPFRSAIRNLPARADRAGISAAAQLANGLIVFCAGTTGLVADRHGRHCCGSNQTRSRPVADRQRRRKRRRYSPTSWSTHDADPLDDPFHGAALRASSKCGPKTRQDNRQRRRSGGGGPTALRGGRKKGEDGQYVTGTRQKKRFRACMLRRKESACEPESDNSREDATQQGEGR